ncbi:class I SAM-dependent methyltransferase [Natranaerobius thermophilus]|uniref:Methyltransferase type 11 n=1 Tax=Natranaerobius thermophilus (strain ATCC BAA-1301 / DSM 18059 / JW/NM-WN-LF) TaxID=457570 RepID=B2A7E1_NATTJ|nr:methyltransferase domain-containing protein [Natranaerobius thermophilus]ACB84333.1 Methyltransferase type 11 [Natranaerobius thermophilus JW/NM-WN-LF]
MKETTLSLLINPSTGNELKKEGQKLIDTKTGEQFTISDAIPIMLKDDQVIGQNHKYQKIYDWLSYFYDTLTLIYAKVYGSAYDVAAELAQIIEIEENDLVLETSVGTGNQVKNLLDHGKTGQFVGLDISYGMLKRCQSKTQLSSNLDLVQGNAEMLPFKDESFDVVYHFGGINFFNNRKKAILEMIRVAKPGAKIYIGDETEDVVKKQPSFLDRFFETPGPKNGSDIYTPPVDLIPDDMENVTERKLWNNRIYHISFQKPNVTSHD